MTPDVDAMRAAAESDNKWQSVIADKDAEIAKLRASVDAVLDGRDETIRKLEAEMQTIRQQTARECMDIVQRCRMSPWTAYESIRERFSLESR